MNDFYIDWLIKERRRLETEECRRAQLLKAADSDLPDWQMEFSRLLAKLINLWNTKIANDREKKSYVS
ncbi:MAG: hypothetical protein QNJ17_05120 [Desulfocapsaceae bacterium]|nr:hypothetical protein [Desulfocapsaceae bacterium]